MKLTRNISVVVLFAVVIFAACVEEFQMDLDGNDNILVIDGSIIKGETLQKVVISRSTAILNPEFDAVSGCQVVVTDNGGNEFVFIETEAGIYTSEIPEAYLTYDNEFQLYVKTAAGTEYLSSREKILEATPVDSVYYLEESYQSSTEQHSLGLQFYVDLKAPDHAARNYMWKLEETWEIHTFYSIDGFFRKTDTLPPKYKPISDSISVCWATQYIGRSFTSSTENLVVNEKKKIPLSYLPSTDPKTNVGYSLLIKQYALNDDAYKYHNQNNVATEGTGGLYENQPSQSISNISNINNPTETVLGFFWASSFTQKRIFFAGPLEIVNSAHCSGIVPCEPQIGETLLQYLKRQDRNLFLVAMQFSVAPPDSVTLWGFPQNQLCIDCTTEGATTIKPDFWKN